MWISKKLCRKTRPSRLNKLSRHMKTPASAKYAFTKTPADIHSTGAPAKPPRFCAEQYARNNRLQRTHSNAVLNVYQPTFQTEITSATKILDVGCGTGDYTRDCLLPRCQPCQRIVAIDWSSDMIGYARGHFGHEKIRYEVLDITSNSVAVFTRRHGLFHRVYSFFCLHWVKNLGAALKNIAHLLTPGGECLLLFPASKQPTAFWQMLAGMERWAKYSEVLLSLVPESQNMASKQERFEYISSLLYGAGLSPTNLDVSRLDTFDGSSGEDKISLHLGIVPIAALVSDEKRLQLFEDVIALARKLHGPETHQSRFCMYIIKATKELKS